MLQDFLLYLYYQSYNLANFFYKCYAYNPSAFSEIIIPAIPFYTLIKLYCVIHFNSYYYINASLSDQYCIPVQIVLRLIKRLILMFTQAHTIPFIHIIHWTANNGFHLISRLLLNNQSIKNNIIIYKRTFVRYFLR